MVTCINYACLLTAPYRSRLVSICLVNVQRRTGRVLLNAAWSFVTPCSVVHRRWSTTRPLSHQALLRLGVGREGAFALSWRYMN